ncbi:N-acetylmuramoyl-L-alanine amidase [Gracilibacillus ureilyticus]|uniref:N-acetylmuramoyl-L-alanine amidase n=1 Tax=Gracilibacillus ureilyticus TaxID=531814 RepID=A0A1H9RCB1_9BACI|nr:N-acetylmuramoyl-L-alanine amidase [Gracilibacillus ureilyticus]SER70175.1 N-acetylmuramoyl-L-alanine amidase [Gracilibacillus ureilyticus]
MHKKILSSVLFIMMVSFICLSQSVSANTLPDVPEKYKDMINPLIEEGIITGYTNGTFKPNNNVTRAEAATMIGRALHLDGNQQASSLFSDVDVSHYASGYIQSAVNKGIVSGYPNGTFKPDDSITRGEMAVIVSRAFELSDKANVTFSDVVGTSYESFISKVYAAEIVSGYPDGTFKPDKPINRAEFSIMVFRALNPVVDKPQPAPAPKPEPKPEPAPAPKPDPEPDKPIATKYVNVTTSLNVRSGPGTSYSKVGSLYRNNEVKVLKYSGDWAQIESGSIIGYVHADYLMDQPEKLRGIITIDPGHGDHDPGATANGVKEKDINLDVAKYVRQYLEAEGIKVVMTRTDDTFLSLGRRVEIAENANSDAFVSIHANAATASANGTETFYSTASRATDSKKLAEFIQTRLVKALGTNDRGVKEGGFQVIKYNSLPSALVELGFLTNTGDVKILLAKKEEAGEAIAQGIMDYYNWKE